MAQIRGKFLWLTSAIYHFLVSMVIACLIFINDTSEVKAAIKSRIRE